jgi:gliding motility-associated-like protein
MKTVSVSLSITILLGIQLSISGQPVVDFTLPDSSCVGAQINITNLTTGGSTFYWNFCSGNANSDPTGVNIGNAGNLLDVPTYITLVQDGNNYYSFISCQFAGIIRYFHGTSFSHNPISWTNLGTFGLLGNHIEGIQVKKDNGNWVGFVCNNTTLVRLNFGTSLANTPTATDVGPFAGLDMLHGLIVLKEGTTWLAFATCSTGNKFVKFNFGTTLNNIPILTDFGTLGVISNPAPLCIVQENLLWYALLNCNNINLVRLSFGNSLLNVPTGENLGNPGGYNLAGGLSILRDCDLTSGYFTNYLTNGQLGKLIFTGGVTGTVTGQILGNIGNLNLPHSFSEIFRQNDTLFAYITNRGSNTLTRLTFPPCANASVPSSTLFNPLPFSYNQPGTYNVRLIVNEGMPDQVSLCKTIVIGPVPVVDLGPDRIFCSDTSTILDAGPGFTTYLWSTGATTRTITVSVTGIYYVTVTKTGCSASDTVNVSFYPVTSVNLGPDTTVCLGQSVTFDAGPCAGCTYLWTDLATGLPVGTNQTFTTAQAGTYKATVTNTVGCQAMDTVQLFTITSVVVTNDPLAKSICSGNSTNIILTANVPDATFSWYASGSSSFVSGYSPGTGDTINQVLTNTNTVNETVTYSITPAFANCPGTTAAYIVTVIPLLTVNVSIAASANIICPGTPVTFTATPTNGGTIPYYQWNVNGINTGPNSPIYTYTPFNNDAVYCLLTSDLNCSSGNPATSNTIHVTFYQVTPINLGPDTTICPGNTITFNAGACSGCSYLWSNLTTGQQNIGTGQTFTTGDTGAYCVAVTDSNSCITQDTIQLFIYSFTPGITGNNTPCLDTLSYYYQTETGMSNYQWGISSGGTIVSGTGTDQIRVKWNNPGSQLVRVNYTTTAGCTASGPTLFPILVYPVPDPAGNINGPTQFCTGSADQTYSVDSIPFAQTYVWQLPNGFQITSGQGTNTITISFDTSVSSGDFYVYGMNLCGTGQLSLPFHFTVLQSPVVDAGPDQSILYDSTTVLTGVVTGGSGEGYSYSWQPSAMLIDNTSLSPRTVKLTHDTLFILTAIDLVNGCKGTDSVRVKVVHPEIIEDCLVFYNVITPNGDGVNDKWIIDCIENFPENNVIIFNIWGDKIISFKNYDNTDQVWAGTNQNGRPLPDGTYYYVLSIKNGGTFTGWILLRGH